MHPHVHPDTDYLQLFWLSEQKRRFFNGDNETEEVDTRKIAS